MADNEKLFSNRNEADSFFQRMTKLFQSGPSIQKKIKNQDYNSFFSDKITKNNFGYRSAPGGFGREQNNYSSYGFSNTTGMGILDRMSRYADFSMMETIPEINAALDIVADEAVGGDDRGKSFHVFSKNPQIKEALDDLFYDVLNVEYNIRPWVRNLIKYGDFFLFNEVIPDVGVVSVFPLPVNEVERKEGINPTDPYAVQFVWNKTGNMVLENWQVTHFRLLGNDQFLPYGSSFLDSSRRIAHQLMLMEDSMLVYRLVRSSERRVYYIDVGNTDPNDIPSYMEAVKTGLKSNVIVDRQNGRMDNRFNPLSLTDDIFIPTRGGNTGTKIDQLPAGANATAVEDVQYIQNKLFAALKIPKAYLNYVESTGGKATLAQSDVRFSRTIGMIQKIIIQEMNKLAMIHLYTKGFSGEDLTDYQLKLSNPSTIAVQQRLELWASKFDIAGKAKESLLADSVWIQRNILELTDNDIIDINKGLRVDKLREVEFEAIAVAEDSTELANRTAGTFSNGNTANIPGEDLTPGQIASMTSKDQLANGSKIAITPSGVAIKTQPETTDDIIKRIDLYGNAVDAGNIKYLEGTSDAETKGSPIKASPFLSSQERKNEKRRLGSRGAGYLEEPDFNLMLNPVKNRASKDITDKTFFNSIKEDFLRENEIQSLLDSIAPQRIAKGTVTKELRSMFRRFDEKYREPKILIENVNLDNLAEENEFNNNETTNDEDEYDKREEEEETFSIEVVPDQDNEPTAGSKKLNLNDVLSEYHAKYQSSSLEEQTTVDLDELTKDLDK